VRAPQTPTFIYLSQIIRTRTLWNEEHTEHVHRTICRECVVNENWLLH